MYVILLLSQLVHEARKKYRSTKSQIHRTSKHIYGVYTFTRAKPLPLPLPLPHSSRLIISKIQTAEFNGPRIQLIRRPPN